MGRRLGGSAGSSYAIVDVLWFRLTPIPKSELVCDLDTLVIVSVVLVSFYKQKIPAIVDKFDRFGLVGNKDRVYRS